MSRLLNKNDRKETLRIANKVETKLSNRRRENMSESEMEPKIFGFLSIKENGKRHSIYFYFDCHIFKL